MTKPLFSVAISTYNRASLIGRAIESALQQGPFVSEIIVVDDASTDNTAQVIAKRYSTVRYLLQSHNKGCCAARNRALREATGRFVVILDDDDTLRPAALAVVADRLKEIGSQAKDYPVYQFAHGTGKIAAPFMTIGINDYIRGDLTGDFLPVIHRESFLKLGFAYPEIRSAGEHLLWWKVAAQFGIPTWADRVCAVHDDAPIRLTSPRNQIAHAAVYAELQEITLAEFGETILKLSPPEYLKRLWGAATYRILSGNRSAARAHLRTAFERRFSSTTSALWVASFFPSGLVRTLFQFFRRERNSVK